MSDEIAVEFEINEETIETEFDVSEGEHFDALFEVNATGTSWGNIDGNIENQTDLVDALNSKQDVLTAGDNITIEDNVISATDTTYTAGNGISIENNVISNTQTSAEWGNIEGNLSDQTDLKDALDTLDGAIDSNHREITNISTTIQGYGDIVTHDADEFATASQGSLADSALQPNDNITELTNNAGYITGIDGQDVTEALGYTPYNSTNPNGYITGIDSADVTNALGYTPYDDSNPDGYITSADLPTVNNSTITIQKNGSTVESFNLNQSNNETINITVPTQASDVNAVPTTRTVNGKALNTNITLNASDVGALSDTTTINDLTTQAQQDALNSGATVTNIGQIASNTQAITLETTNRQNADNNLQSQIDAIVSSSDVFDIVGTYAELQAYDISTVPVNDIIKVLVDSTHSNAATYYRCVENNNVKSWSYIGSEGAYYTKSEADGRFVSQTTTVNGQALSSNITLDAQDVGALPDSTVIPTATSDLTNDSGYITSSALSGYATESWVGQQGYLTGIDDSDVTTALGYTPVNPSTLSTVATSGSYNDLTNKPTIPTVNNATLTIQKNGVNVQTFTANSSSNKTANITVPTDTNDLTNGAGFITSSDVPTEIFVATYGTTTLSDIQTAYNAGKIILCKYNTDDIYTLSSISQNYAEFSRTSDFYCYTITCDRANHWLKSGGQAQKTSNLVTSVSSSSTDTQYPSAKCVYDELANKADTDLSNCTKPYVTESYGQFAVYGSWYRVWSDGFIEQGGSLKPSADSNALEIIFLKTYQGHPTVVTTASYDNGSYTANTSNCSNRNANMVACSIGDISSFNFYVNRVGTNWIVNWYACGY